jgi:uncharacterized Ntn-hydrolase superfamily protein
LTCVEPPSAFTAGTGAPGEKPNSDTAAIARELKQCIFSGMKESELPRWFKIRVDDHTSRPQSAGFD